MNKTTPYTYLIGWPALNMWYYGVRYAHGCNPAELWQTYFTSSSHVANFVAEHGDPTHIEIRKIFTEVSTAQVWEHRVLKRMKVIYRDDYLNKTDNISIAPRYGSSNSSTRPEVQEKISVGVLKWYETNDNPNLGTTWTEEEKREWGEIRTGKNNPFYGHKHTDSNLRLYSVLQQGSNNSFYNKEHSAEQKKIWSVKRSGIPKPKCSCVNCRQEFGINGITRHARICYK